VVLAGDAAGVASPLTGEGIGPAMRSAELAAACIARRVLAERCGGTPDYAQALWTDHVARQRSRLWAVRAAARLTPGAQGLLFHRVVFSRLVAEMISPD
jgi:flavin-dependent dehydrogenase